MALTGFLRTPFLPVAGSTAADYELIEDQLDHLTVRVNGTTPDRLKLQPVFPGTLTFKPLPGERVPDDPSTAGPIRGNLFLSLDPKRQEDIAKGAPHLNYQFVFGYLGVTLDSSFFTNVALPSLRNPAGTYSIKVEGKNLTTAGQVAKAFARGDISADINPELPLLRGYFPSLIRQSGAVAEATLVLRVYQLLNQLGHAPSLTTQDILTGENFVPIPVAYFYRALSHLPSWPNALASPDHASHAFITSIQGSDRYEEGSPNMRRWRRLRISPPNRHRSPTLEYKGATADAFQGGVPLWDSAVNPLGEIFVRREDEESFSLEVRGEGRQIIKLRKGLVGPYSNSVNLTWNAPGSDRESEIIDIEADVLNDDPLALPFRPIPFNAVDDVRITRLPDGRVCHGELVRPLQRLLRTLGFKIITAETRPFDHPHTSGTFDLHTSWALREFQIYAAMDTVAVETLTAPRYADRLQAIDNPAPYTGEVTGIFDEATATALRAWRTNNLRCPVVIEKWSVDADGKPLLLLADNIWHPIEASPDEGANPDECRVFVRDLSEHYDIPVSRLVPAGGELSDAGRVLLGYYRLRGDHHGMASTRYRLDRKPPDPAPPFIPTTWDGIEVNDRDEPDDSDTNVTPIRLVGRALPIAPEPDDAAYSSVSTYKVISAVSYVEQDYVFDSINCYDSGVVSMGACHWIAFLTGSADRYNDQKNDVELPAFLAILKARAPEAYEKFFGCFGIRPSKTWEYPPGRNSLYNAKAKWIARFQQRGLRKRNPLGVATDEIDPSFSSIPSDDFEDADYLRTWHWFYRWVMANRLSQEVQRQQWYFARLRVREILNAQWGDEHPKLEYVKDVYSSERLVTILLRAHVNQPELVIAALPRSGSDSNLVPKAKGALRAAFVRSGIDGNASQWPDADMSRLEESLIDELTTPDSDLERSIRKALNFIPEVSGHNLQPLKKSRNSFKLDDSGLDQA